jgi:hypothetical protein
MGSAGGRRDLSYHCVAGVRLGERSGSGQQVNTAALRVTFDVFQRPDVVGGELIGEVTPPRLVVRRKVSP